MGWAQVVLCSVAWEDARARASCSKTPHSGGRWSSSPLGSLRQPVQVGMLEGAQIFTKLDLCNAYHLLHIQEGDEWKMPFNTPMWHYEYLVMLFRPYQFSSRLQKHG